MRLWVVGDGLWGMGYVLKVIGNGVKIKNVNMENVKSGFIRSKD